MPTVKLSCVLAVAVGLSAPSVVSNPDGGPDGGNLPPDCSDAYASPDEL